MPPSAGETRTKLIDAAAKAFADEGVFTASLIDITRKAGQRNRGALYYHFGSREGVLCAVLERHVEFLAEREGELLEKALTEPDHDVRSVVEAIVRPAAELADSGWRGGCFLRILTELIEVDQSTLGDGVREMLDRTGGYEVYAVLAERMPAMAREVQVERLALATAFILRSVAHRARATHPRARAGRPQLADEIFVENLVDMVTAALTAPTEPYGRRSG